MVPILVLRVADPLDNVCLPRKQAVRGIAATRADGGGGVLSSHRY